MVTNRPIETLEYPFIRKNGDKVGASVRWRVIKPPSIVRWRGQLFSLTGSYLEGRYYQQIDNYADVCEEQVTYYDADPNALSLFD